MSTLFLQKSHYSLSASLLWGNCVAHFDAFYSEPSLNGKALTHLVVAVLESLPGISQILSLFEEFAAWIYYWMTTEVRFDDQPLEATIRPPSLQRPLKGILKQPKRQPEEYRSHNQEPFTVQPLSTQRTYPANIVFVNERDYLPHSANLTTFQKQLLLRTLLLKQENRFDAASCTIAIERAKLWRKFIVHIKPYDNELQTSIHIENETPHHGIVCQIIRELMHPKSTPIISV